MLVENLTVGQLQANCYLLTDILSGEVVIIDPGDDGELIMEKIRSVGEGLDPRPRPVAILATHGHFDHVMAATELQMAYDIPFYIHEKDQFLLDRMEETVRYFLGQNVVVPPPPQQAFYSQGEKLEIGKWRFDIVHTPGHTPGSVSIRTWTHLGASLLFCGDVLFARGGFGRTDFSYSSLTDLEHSIQTLMQLPAGTRVYPGHGEETTIGKEKQQWS